MKHEEDELLETQSIPLRNYIMRHILPTLTEGLVEVCKVRPDDPVDYLVSIRGGACYVLTTHPHYIGRVSIQAQPSDRLMIVMATELMNN